ncbi:hypothetical protein J8F10_20925 [Gemmata sp. G18]|uniref:Uncharacterized protein n=1 Tax=Gemmata palustris TaxID=2822762 RepID=A0ABS5BVF4_9BACT|nr:hypothetical protein [Gemmata palustris]MBP3957722.1 hypothetical protein [Gemmata palustris]
MSERRRFAFPATRSNRGEHFGDDTFGILIWTTRFGSSVSSVQFCLQFHTPIAAESCIAIHSDSEGFAVCNGEFVSFYHTVCVILSRSQRVSTGDVNEQIQVPTAARDAE